LIDGRKARAGRQPASSEKGEVMNGNRRKLFALVWLVVGLGSATAAAAPAVVIERDIEYQPAELTVHVGDEIRVQNKDPFAHKTLVQQQQSDGRLGATIVAGHMDEPGTSFTFTVDTPGTYQLRCLLHDGMSAVVRVLE